MKSVSPPSKFDEVTAKDWLLALIGLFFTLGGLLTLPKDFRVGITTLAFFGPCFVLFVHTILRKLRLQKQSTVGARVVGGTPIRPSKARIALLGLGLLVVGTILAVFQPDQNRVYLGCAVITALVGAAVLGGLATGLLARSFIQFDPQGISIGRFGGTATVPWSAITQLARGEIHSNPTVLVWVDRQAVRSEPAAYLAKLHKQMDSSQRWLGADFAIMSSTYGIDAPVLLAALERYTASPEARDELAVQAKLGG